MASPQDGIPVVEPGSKSPVRWRNRDCSLSKIALSSGIGAGGRDIARTARSRSHIH